MKEDEKLAALNNTLVLCKKSSFYRNRLPVKLNSLAELKEIPVTTKEDLRKNSPFGLVCVPGKELYQYHESFGTTGTPVSSWLTKEDLRTNGRQINSGGIYFSKDDTVLVRFPYAISSIAHYVHTAAQLKGACVIPASSRTTVSPFPRIIELMQKLKVTVLAGLPLQALLLAETAEMLGLDPAQDFPKLRAIFVAGETLTESKRKLLADIWNVQIINNYGMTEVGSMLTDCEFCRLHPSEEYYIFEIVRDDLKTKVKPGEIGNLVVTTLVKKATPVMRFLTGDRAKTVSEECACGQEVSIEIHGREQDAMKIGKRVLDLWDLDEIVSHLPCRRFWVVGPRNKGVLFVVEEEQEDTHISMELIRHLEKKYKLPIEIEIVPRGTIYERRKLLEAGEAGKPRYIYSAQEIKRKAYLRATRL